MGWEFFNRLICNSQLKNYTMKKQITFFTMMAIAASLFFISSCSKKETVETDLTASLVGTYIGTFVDCTSGVVGTIYDPNQVVKITKIDNTHIRFTPTSTSSASDFQAEVIADNTVGSILKISSGTFGGDFFVGVDITVSGVICNGVYTNSTKEFVSQEFIIGGSDWQGYKGTKQ